jgi:UDP-N-acetylmuramyl pentapeptide synthase
MWRWSTTPCAPISKDSARVEAVARAKGEIYAGLKDDGIALINIDDPHADLWRSLAIRHKVMSFRLCRTGRCAHRCSQSD